MPKSMLYNINVFYLSTLLKIIRSFFAIPIIISNFGTLNCILCAMTACSPTPKSLEKWRLVEGKHKKSVIGAWFSGILKFRRPQDVKRATRGFTLFRAYTKVHDLNKKQSERSLRTQTLKSGSMGNSIRQSSKDTTTRE